MRYARDSLVVACCAQCSVMLVCDRRRRPEWIRWGKCDGSGARLHPAFNACLSWWLRANYAVHGGGYAQSVAPQYSLSLALGLIP